MSAPACPYCDEAALLVDRGVIDADHPVGFAWLCVPCDAWIPCHKNSQKPMGRLAKPALHEARKQAISSFNKLWKTWGANRHNAFKWLAEKMEIEIAACDFYKFDIKQCHLAQDIADSFTPQFNEVF